MPVDEGGAGRRVHIRGIEEDVDTGEGGKSMSLKHEPALEPLHSRRRAPVEDLPREDAGESKGLRAGRGKARSSRGAMSLRGFRTGEAGLQKIGRGVVLFAAMLLCMEEAAAVPPVAPTGLQVCPGALSLYLGSPVC